MFLNVVVSGANSPWIKNVTVSDTASDIDAEAFLRTFLGKLVTNTNIHDLLSAAHIIKNLPAHFLRLEKVAISRKLQWIHTT